MQSKQVERETIIARCACLAVAAETPRGFLLKIQIQIQIKVQKIEILIKFKYKYKQISTCFKNLINRRRS